MEPSLARLAIPMLLGLMATQDRPRLRDLGIEIGRLETGKWNAITDVPGVRVGHATLVRGDDVRTGVTVVLPHDGNVYRDKVPATLVVGNGYGKLVGATQLVELGELESPIALTNTLNVHRVADALLGWMLRRKGNENVRSLNVVVGETNDGRLNDIRGRHVTADEVAYALDNAKSGAVTEGSVGAGTGTRCFGWKGGIGTSSRKLGKHTVGVLVQTNFGGTLRIGGRVVTRRDLEPDAPESRREDEEDEHGSCMIIVATDAPLETRNLARLGKRALAGMAKTGASFSNGSGDYVLVFSTARGDSQKPIPNSQMTGLFVAAADATEEAILNSLLAATTVKSKFGEAKAIPIPALERALGRDK